MDNKSKSEDTKKENPNQKKSQSEISNKDQSTSKHKTNPKSEKSKIDNDKKNSPIKAILKVLSITILILSIVLYIYKKKPINIKLSFTSDKNLKNITNITQNSNDSSSSIPMYTPHQSYSVNPKFISSIIPNSTQSILLYSHQYALCPFHPRTVYFVNQFYPDVPQSLRKNQSNKNPNSRYVSKIKITNKKFMIFYKGGKYSPEPLINVLKFSNIINAEYNFSNLIYTKAPGDKREKMVNNLTRFQKLNYYPFYDLISRKINLYLHHMKMKKIWKEEYDFMPLTFIFPKDKVKFYKYLYSIEEENEKNNSNFSGDGLRRLEEVVVIEDQGNNGVNKKGKNKDTKTNKSKGDKDVEDFMMKINKDKENEYKKLFESKEKGAHRNTKENKVKVIEDEKYKGNKINKSTTKDIVDNKDKANEKINNTMNTNKVTKILNKTNISNNTSSKIIPNKNKTKESSKINKISKNQEAPKPNIQINGDQSNISKNNSKNAKNMTKSTDSSKAKIQNVPIKNHTIEKLEKSKFEEHQKSERIIISKIPKFSKNQKEKYYTFNTSNLWLIKPPDKSLGIGVHLMTSLSKIPDNFLVTHYISNPHLINGKKYHLRCYVLVTGFHPLKIYFYRDGVIRFAIKKFNITKDNLNDKDVHLSIVGVDVNNPQENVNVDGEEGVVWTFEVLRKYYEKNGIDYNKIRNRIKDVIIKTFFSELDTINKLRYKNHFNTNRSFELYGIDILIDENLKPWLLEVNLNPGLHGYCDVDRKVITLMLTDLLNIVGIVPFDHANENEAMDTSMNIKDKMKEMFYETMCEFNRPVGNFERVFPLEKNIKKYRKYTKSPGKENLFLWNRMLHQGGFKE